jgi:hypothetical protein
MLHGCLPPCDTYNFSPSVSVIVVLGCRSEGIA